MGTGEAVSTYDGNERCDWERCVGYPEDDGVEMVKREEGVFHQECDDAITHEEAAFWRRQWAGGVREPERIDAVLERVFGQGDDLRTAEQEG